MILWNGYRRLRNRGIAAVGVALLLCGPVAFGQEQPAEASTSLQVIDFDNVLTIYELPSNIRRDLPELTINMLYFAKEREDRFAKINGTRAEEEDVVGQELWLKKIKRDGVVMQFRDHFFFLPR